MSLGGGFCPIKVSSILFAFIRLQKRPISLNITYLVLTSYPYLNTLIPPFTGMVCPCHSWCELVQAVSVGAKISTSVNAT